ncbi:Multiple antibiotic resistance protein marR [Achromobacter spanius]|jgi:DNA-binding MarR family transcriptional regulator|uniref:MarR family winged helix-turn-helix transcriptional regulator n=1 Tax=Achromobacter TaxID=222 RepID=UPI000C2CA0D1|nr:MULTISPECIES: MarR family transcriptional regulator [Achromobacter]AUA59157.1 MarR family transcriptional regulator [Achromobacter spanius]MCS3504235.1 DNA-binding MarR family transcriptional regulator [Achromobacter sp. JUb104]CAB3705850.1 HTH-type transcriptional regulator MhqR [Achromobacter spanius]VEE58654.1 Multiple antibiotic resistance protein marR [Achromobacter spanius]
MPTSDLVDLVISQWSTECPTQDFAAMAVITRVFRLNAFATRNVNRSFRRHNLHQGEFDVLATLYRTGAPHAMNPQKLVDALLLTSGAMTNRLDRLEQAGLLVRNPNPDDRRGIIVSLTAEGLRVIKLVLKDYLKDLGELLDPLSVAERKQLAGLLKKLLLKHDQETPGGIGV